MRSRAGVVFSLMGVLVAGFIILLFWASNRPVLNTGHESAAIRVRVLDMHLRAWDSYVEDAMRGATRDALRNLTNRIDNETLQVEVQGFATALRDCLVTGSATFAGDAGDCYADPSSQSFTGRLDNFATIAENYLDFTSTYSLSSKLVIIDWRPFDIKIGFVLNKTISDSPFVVWNRSRDYEVIVNIEGLPDPLFRRYGVDALGGQQRNITEYPVARDSLTKANISDLIQQRMYVENLGMAPTYLERLNLTINPPFDSNNRAGIQTLLDPADVALSWLAAGLQKNASYTAQQVFNEEFSYRCGTDTYGIKNFDLPLFRLDVGNLARYGFNASSSTINNTCS